MPSRIPHFGKRATASQRVTDKRMPTVMDGKRSQPLGAETFTSRAEPLPQRVERAADFPVRP